jgi:hypothetical protein
MKSKLRFLMVLSIIGILCGIVLPGVNGEIYKLGTKVSESDLDLRDRKLVYFNSGTIVYTEPDYTDHLSSIFDGDETTGINHFFGPGHEVLWIELIFSSKINVTTISVKPNFGGGATNYTLYVNSDGIWSPWFAQKNTDERTFSVNCEIKGIWLELDNEGTNHFYFNDIIINYVPAKSPEVLDNINDDDFDILEFFIVPPFFGLLWIILIVTLILSLRRGKGRRKAKEKGEPDNQPEPKEEDISPAEPEESPPPEKEQATGRFCPSCGKFTEEKGPFCPHCKRSME